MGQLTFFLDENLQGCSPVTEVLEAAQVKVQLHRQHFAPGVADESWLPVAGKSGWIVLTVDSRIRVNEVERTALLAHGVRLFYFANANMNKKEMAETLRHALPEMLETIATFPAPFAARILKSGQVVLSLDATGKRWNICCSFLQFRKATAETRQFLRPVGPPREQPL